jgi:hypothetical protein
MWMHERDIYTGKGESERQQQFARIYAKAILSFYKAGASVLGTKIKGKTGDSNKKIDRKKSHSRKDEPDRVTFEKNEENFPALSV